MLVYVAVGMGVIGITSMYFKSEKTQYRMFGEPKPSYSPPNYWLLLDNGAKSSVREKLKGGYRSKYNYGDNILKKEDSDAFHCDTEARQVGSVLVCEIQGWQFVEGTMQAWRSLERRHPRAHFMCGPRTAWCQWIPGRATNDGKRYELHLRPEGRTELERKLYHNIRPETRPKVEQLCFFITPVSKSGPEAVEILYLDYDSLTWRRHDPGLAADKTNRSRQIEVQTRSGRSNRIIHYVLAKEVKVINHSDYNQLFSLDLGDLATPIYSHGNALRVRPSVPWGVAGTPICIAESS